MKTASRKLARGLVAGFFASLLSSCGGGGGSAGSYTPPPPPPAGTLSISADTISFKANGPYAQAPANQTITGTVTGLTTSGTLYITVTADNPNGFFTVSNVVITGNAGQLNVIPALPSSLEAGSFAGSITVNACLNDPTCHTGQLSGSPQTIPVKYDIASGVDGNTVTPHVVTANTAGTVILRGSGFTGATSVSFGSQTAASMTVVSDTEIDASYAMLPAGTYPVTVDSGGIGFNASLVAVPPSAFTATALPYPAGTALRNALQIAYDAQRMALFVLVQGDYQNTLLRYAFDGTAWGSPTQLTMTNLLEVQLSPDGTHLLALTEDGLQANMLELDPVTMVQTNVTSTPATNTCGFALANDGNAIVGLAPGPGVVFGTFSRVMTPMSTGSCPTVASGDGSIVALNGGIYFASTETVDISGLQLGGSADFAGDKFLNEGTLEDQTGRILGSVSSPFDVINSAGTRGYGYTANPVSCAPTLSAYDLTATPSGSPNPQFPVLGTPIALPSSCLNSTNSGYLLAITPDGATVFVARPDGVVVQPVPP